MKVIDSLGVMLAAIVLAGSPALAQNEGTLRPVDIAPSAVVLGASPAAPDASVPQDAKVAEEYYRQGLDAIAAKNSEKARQAFIASCAAGGGAACYHIASILDEQETKAAATATPAPALAAATAAVEGDEAVAPEPKAADYYQRACNLNFQHACTVYAGLLQTGEKGVLQDKTKALALFRNACDRNDAGACQSLADATYQGDGVPKDLTSAAELYRKACEFSGAGKTCFNYGLMRERGIGVDADAAEALTYYRRACQRKAEEGCTNLAIRYAEGDGVPQDAELAAGFFSEGCKNGDFNACNNLAYVTRTGKGVAQNSEGAADLYRANCDKGDGAACYGLGQMAMEREPGAGGKAKAYPLFVKACNVNYARGCYNAGLTRWIGWGTGKNLEEGYRWFTKGCGLNDASSCGGAAILTVGRANGEGDEVKGLSPETKAEAMKWLAAGKRIDADNILIKSAEEWLAKAESGEGAEDPAKAIAEETAG